MMLALFTLFALSGQAAAPAPSQAPAMPATAGWTASPDCGGIREIAAGGDRPMQCVTAPMEQIGALAQGYAAEASRRGWMRTGANNNVLWMQKVEAAGTCERMTLIVFWDLTRYPEPRAGIPGYIGTIIEPGLPCEALSPAPAPAAPTR
ncbi:hypothetical protein [Brevundimonas sp. FT23042]|uniref:hypothetical protein n=1 Tax=Brevundimonas sp. FT23042 TaxID=3393749 RepID=UPI003B589212